MMQVTKEETTTRTVMLDIQLDAETVDKGFDRAYRDFARFTSVPGFRPGKAPRPMLERYVNQEKLRERVMEIIAPPAYREALEQESIQPFGDPEVEFSDLAPGEPWQFKAEVALPPIVELGDYSDIPVERPVFTVTDDQIEGHLQRMREEHARLAPVEDRGVQEGDVLIAETSVTAEGDEPKEPRRTLIRLGNNIPGFDEAVLGMTAGEERTFELTYPEDFQDAEVAGKKAEFFVRLHTINEKQLPELTDEWVSQNTAYQTLDEMETEIRKQLEESYKDLSDRITENRILDAIIGRSKLEFPPVMVRDEMNKEAHELSHELAERKLSYEEYLQGNGLTEDQHRARMGAAAEGRVKSQLILRELMKAEKVEIAGEEVLNEFASRIADAGLSEEDADRLLREKGRVDQVANLVLRRKLRDLLFSHAKIADVPTTPNA